MQTFYPFYSVGREGFLHLRALLFLVLSFCFTFGGVVIGRSLIARGGDHQANMRDGSFRAMYFIHWVMIFIALLVFLLPLSLTFRSQIAQYATLAEVRLQYLLKVLILPVLIFLLIRVGLVKGYMRWIEDMNWGDRDRK